MLRIRIRFRWFWRRWKVLILCFPSAQEKSKWDTGLHYFLYSERKISIRLIRNSDIILSILYGQLGIPMLYNLFYWPKSELCINFALFFAKSGPINFAFNALTQMGRNFLNMYPFAIVLVVLKSWESGLSNYANLIDNWTIFVDFWREFGRNFVTVFFQRHELCKIVAYFYWILHI